MKPKNKERRVPALLLLVSLALSCSLLRPERRSYEVPSNMWKVTAAAPTHLGQMFMVVTVEQGFAWPKTDSGTPVQYRISLWRPNISDALPDVGRITEDERFAVVYIAPPGIASDLNATADDDRRHFGERTEQETSAIASLPEIETEIPEDILNRVDVVTRLFQNENALQADEIPPVKDIEIELVPYAGDEGLARQDTEKKKPALPAYKWGEIVTAENDPCKGKTPEACAREKLEKLIERICNEKKADGTPRFPDECIHLQAMGLRNPPEPKIECDLNSGNGTGLGATDPVSALITLNGSAFLTDDCADAVLMHELAHFLEFISPIGILKYSNLKKLKEAFDRLEKARAAAEAAKAAGDQQALKRAVAEIRKLAKDINDLRVEAGKERIEAECNAYFKTIDNADFFGYPGTGTAWMKQNLKDFVLELQEVRTGFKLELGTPAVKGALCNCFKKIRDWVNGRADIKSNFDKDLSTAKTPEPPGRMPFPSLLRIIAESNLKLDDEDRNAVAAVWPSALERSWPSIPAIHTGCHVLP